MRISLLEVISQNCFSFCCQIWRSLLSDILSDVREVGAVLVIQLYCHACGNEWDWQSAGEGREGSTVMNALLTGSILYTGSQPSKVKEYV